MQSDEHAVNRVLKRVRIEAKTCGEAALRIQVDKQHPLALFSKRSTETNTGGRLPDASLLASRSVDVSHKDRTAALCQAVDKLC